MLTIRLPIDDMIITYRQVMTFLLLLLSLKGSEPSSTGWGVDIQTQHLSSNPHGHEFRFLFILGGQALQFILRTMFPVYSRLKILVLMFNGYVHP
jgi:hypothetical protein